MKYIGGGNLAVPEYEKVYTLTQYCDGFLPSKSYQQIARMADWDDEAIRTEMFASGARIAFQAYTVFGQ
jgi:hypothetical protein